MEDDRRTEDKRQSIYFLSAEECLFYADSVDPTRGNMVCNHLNQIVVLARPEIPFYSTGLENQIGRINNTYRINNTDKPIEILHKVNKSKYSTFMILKTVDEKGNDFYDVINHEYAQKITETYGYTSRLNNKLTQGSVIEPGDVVYKSTQYDKDMNFMYGVNLLTVFSNYKNITLEDTIAVSASAASKFDSYDVNVVDVMLNTNDVLINMYGNDENYKVLPEIGDDVKKSVLCGRRRLDYNTILYSFKSDNMKEISETDTLFYIEGKVVDITIYANIDEEEVATKYNKQLFDILYRQNTYYRKCVSLMKSILDITDNVSGDFKFWYHRYKNALEKKWKYNENIFDNMLIQVSVLDTQKLTIGGKITNRAGSKGIVVIIPDDQMPMTSDGKKIECLMNPLSVLQRKNPGQLREIMLSYYAIKIQEKMKELYNIDDIVGTEDLLFSFLKFTNSEYYEQIKDLYNQLDDITKINILKETIDNGIYYRFKPFYDEVDVERLEEIYDAFPFVKKVKLEEMIQEVIYGYMYFIKLKHTAISKYTVRSTGSLSLRDSPAKGREGHKIKFSKTPIRFGEMENNYLGLLDISYIVNLLRSYSTSSEARDSLHNYLLNNNVPFILNDFEPIKVESEDSNIKKVLQSLLRSVGLEINFD